MRANARFTKLPPDILLEIVAESKLDDAITFSQICRRFRSCSTGRSYWMKTLAFTRANHFVLPLAPSQSDLSKHSLQKLKDVAFHALRRERNFSRLDPRLLAPTSISQVDYPYTILSVVTGAPLLLLWNNESGEAICWYTKPGAILASIHVGTCIVEVAQFSDIPGELNVALLVARDEDADSCDMRRLRLRYDLSSYPSEPCCTLAIEGETHIPSGPFSAAEFCVSVTAHSDFVAMIKLAPLIEILVHNLQSGTSCTITTGLDAIISDDPPYQTRAYVAFSAGTLYILTQHKCITSVYRCPPRILPGNKDDTVNAETPTISNLTSLELVYSWKDRLLKAGRHFYDSCLSFDGTNAIACVQSLICPPAPGLVYAEALVVRFFPLKAVEGDPESLMPKQVRLWGQLLDNRQETGWLLFDKTDRISVYVMEHEGKHTLQAIRHDDFSVHFLQIPPGVDLLKTISLQVDDVLGIIYLTDSSSHIVSIFYA